MNDILILNGSPSGQKGNCATLIKSILYPLILKEARNHKLKIKINVIHLNIRDRSLSEKNKLFQNVLNADAIIFVSGTYWDSWGSPLQQFLEDITPLEAHPQIMGKPCSVLILNHSVGGKSVLSRLQGVLNTLGFLIPPMSGWVYSLQNQIIKSHNLKNSHESDFWLLDDLKPLVKNLLLALNLNSKLIQENKKTYWISWPVDQKNPYRKWLK